jgi:hypothetical protein
METFVPVEPTREEAPTGRRGVKFPRFRQLRLGRVLLRRLVVPFLREGTVDDGCAVEVANAADEVGGDGASESLLRGGERVDAREEGGEAVFVGSRRGFNGGGKGRGCGESGQGSGGLRIGGMKEKTHYQVPKAPHPTRRRCRPSTCPSRPFGSRTFPHPVERGWKGRRGWRDQADFADRRT